MPRKKWINWSFVLGICTVVIVGSTPAFPHGICDPVEEMSEIAHQHDIGFHTDACLGGFVYPGQKNWAPMFL